MASIAILIGTPAGTRLLAAASERDAARMSEGVLLTLPAAALPAPVWVQCADDGLARRLSGYLADFQAEIAGSDSRSSPSGASPSGLP